MRRPSQKRRAAAWDVAGEARGGCEARGAGRARRGTEGRTERRAAVALPAAERTARWPLLCGGAEEPCGQAVVPGASGVALHGAR